MKKLNVIRRGLLFCLVLILVPMASLAEKIIPRRVGRGQNRKRLSVGAEKGCRQRESLIRFAERFR